MDGTPELLLQALQAGINALRQLDQHLSSAAVREKLRIVDANQKCRTEVQDALEIIRKEGEGWTSPETYLAVVGDTGTGKSSLINALLDYERMAPSAGFGNAMTAVATTFHYDASVGAGKGFKAEVEYITKEDFVQEAKILLYDMAPWIEATCAGKKAKDRKAGEIAYEKLQAVFPMLTWDALEMFVVDGERRLSFDVDAAMEQLVKDMLEKLPANLFGCCKKLEAESEEEFAELVHNYVTQQLEAEADEDYGNLDGSDSESDEEDLVESNYKAIEAGPGNADSDDEEEASSVCSGSKKKAEKLPWPLIKSFKVFLDSAILQTGVVLVDLPGRHDASPVRAALADKFLETCQAVLVVSDSHRAVDSKTGSQVLQAWLQKSAAGFRDDIVFACTKADNIEARVASKENKRLRNALKPLELRLDELKNKLKKATTESNQLKQKLRRKKIAAREKCALQEQLSKVRDNAEQTNAEMQEIAVQRNWIVISTRNDRVKNMLQQKIAKMYSDKVRGIKTESGQSENMDLPQVFTVSSTEYQKFKGRFDSDGTSDKYPSVEETEIIQLRENITDLAISRRVHAARYFFDECLRPPILTLERFYAADKNGLTEEFRKFLADVVPGELKRLEKSLEACLEKAKTDIEQSISAILKASAESVEAATAHEGQVWDKHAQDMPGYMNHMTLRGLINRNGQFRGFDVNDVVLKAWYHNDVLDNAVTEQANNIKQMLQGYTKSISECISDTHQRITNILQPNHCPTAMDNLNESINTISKGVEKRENNHYVRVFMASHLNALKNTVQVDLNPVYSECRRDRGRGVVRRILNRLDEGVSDKERFLGCQQKLKGMLDVMKDDTLERLQAGIMGVTKKLQLEYGALMNQKTDIKQEDYEKSKACIKECLMAIGKELETVAAAAKSTPEMSLVKRQQAQDSKDESPQVNNLQVARIR